MPRPEAPAPVLPPLATRPHRFELDPARGAPAMIAAPSLAGAVVESDDYVVVHEPLVEPGPSTTSTGNSAGSFVAGVDASPWAGPGPDLGMAAAPTPPAPADFAMSLDCLVRVRDTLLEIAARAQAQATPVDTLATSPPRVMVESSHDRLAMAPMIQKPAPMEPTRIALAPSPAPTLAPRLPALSCRPTSLVQELEALSSLPSAGPWASQVLTLVDRLSREPEPEPSIIAELLAELGRLAADAYVAAPAIAGPAEQSAWIRTTRSLERRLPLWRVALDRQATHDLVDRASQTYADGPLIDSLNQVAALTAGAAEGAAWRTYLRLDDLAGLASIGGIEYAEARRATARDVLLRMSDPRLTAAQVRFLSEPPLAALAHDLRPWASGAVSLQGLAELLERYELTGSLGDAEAIAELRLRLLWSDDPQLQVLAEELNGHYRNANLRVALSAEIFNRLIPPQEPVTVPVNDRIAGAEVHGRSRTETQVRLRLLPSPTEWHFSLDVEGTVNSRTYSDVGPARVRNASRMEYEAAKRITLNRAGLQILPAEAKVDGRNSLVGVESGFDPVPLVGSIVEQVIRNRHRENQARAMAQVKSKVQRQACDRMDREANEKLHAFEQRFAAEVWGALERFALAAEPLDMSTTEERAVVRMRLASQQHLGAHTPRPSAPSDSLASMQMHESAVNNAIRGLALDGRRMTVGELHALLRSKFANRAEAAPTDLPQKAIVEFARRDAVRVACHGDRVELTLNIVELRKGRDSIRNVGVHAFFRPVIDGLEVKLIRDGTLQFEGAHLRTGPRLVLHSVFGKLLRRDQEVPVLAKRVGDDPRFAGLMVTQLVIDDGWIALSLGPESAARTAWRTRGVATR